MFGISVEAPVFLTRMNTRHTSEANALKVMMAASREIVLPSKLPPQEGKQLQKSIIVYTYIELLCEFATHTHELTHTSPFHVFCSRL